MAVEPPYRIKNMMPGMIMLWYGTEETIPSGWHRCDGTMGTPDLRDRFVGGAGETLGQGNFGGAWTHDHDFTGDGHQHTLQPGVGIVDSFPAGVWQAQTGLTPAVGTTDPTVHTPRWYGLHFIMKL